MILNVNEPDYYSIVIGFIAFLLVPIPIAIAIWSNNKYSRESPTVWKPTASSCPSTITARQLIIDGCNGPIKLADRLLDSSSISSSSNESHLAVSLLRVVNGENKGDRINVVPKLDQLLAQDVFGSVTIYFDGLGKKDRADSIWTVSPRLVVKVTKAVDEADDVIVEEVMERSRSTSRATNTNVSEEACLSDVLREEEASTDTVFTITRNAEGPGKSRRLLKPLGLLRRESVFCMFAISPILKSSAVRLAKCLLPMERLIKVEKLVLGVEATLVVTDDVFLRQRVVDAGGFVMTFEQLWDLLSERASNL